MKDDFSTEPLKEDSINREPDIAERRKPLLQLSDDILLYLLEKRKLDHSLKFWLRQRDSNQSSEPRLNVGQWFQGSHYIFVGFSAITDAKNKTQTIGFVANFADFLNPTFHIDLSYPSEERTDHLECYTDIVDEISLSLEQDFDQSSRKHYFKYPENNWKNALDRFLSEHKPIIEKFIRKYGLEKSFSIPEEKFEAMLNKTLDIRASIYPNETTSNESLKVNEQVKLQSESVKVVDMLGRQPFVDSLKTYVEKLWKDKPEGGYTIHLGGEWGSGKSKVLDMLKNELEKDDWVVVEFNAWQNQHIDPPWWVLMDSVYKQVLSSAKNKISVWIKEYWWRLVELNQLYWWSFIGLTTLFLIIGLFSGFTFFKMGSPDVWTKSTTILGIITSGITISGAIWVLFKAIAGSLVPATPDAAMQFQKHVRDPMQELKKHYSSITSYTKNNIAVFIDDIDRCNPQFVVNLLEGIQTLFKNANVLYVVAGDSNWIKKSFEIFYADLEGVVNKPENTIGNFFLEKTFQMSIGLPRISDETKEIFWKHLLQGSQNQDEPNLNENADSNELEEEINSAGDEKTIDDALQKAKTPEEKVKLRGVAVKKMSENDKVLSRVEHKLVRFHQLLEPNPRSMKRLINNYALERKSLILSGVSLTEVSDDHLIRWIILKSRFPLIADELIADPAFLDKFIEKSTGKDLTPILEGLTVDILTKCVRR